MKEKIESLKIWIGTTGKNKVEERFLNLLTAKKMIKLIVEEKQKYFERE